MPEDIEGGAPPPTPPSGETPADPRRTPQIEKDALRRPNFPPTFKRIEVDPLPDLTKPFTGEKLGRQFDPDTGREIRSEGMETLSDALAKLSKAREGLQTTAGMTIDEAVDGLRFDKFGNEAELSKDQVRDVYEAYFRAAGAHLTPAERFAAFNTDESTQIKPKINEEPAASEDVKRNENSEPPIAPQTEPKE